MPYIEGETLRDKLNRETQFGIDEAVRITTEVADALDYAHRQGVIHRDIKPENILLHDGRPMVADFGIALAVSAAAGGRMTETGLSLGTPHYMSPEQATAEKDITNRSDIYSLGAVLYEMLTGNPPHVGASAQQIIMKIVTDTPPPVTNLRKTVPPNIAAAVSQALEKLPADRFETADAFARVLADASFRQHAGNGAPEPSVTRTRSTLRWTAPVASALLVGVVVGMWIRGTTAPAPVPVTRATIEIDPAEAFVGVVLNAGRPIHHALTFTADGRMLVFAGRGADGVPRLFRRSLAAPTATPIDGTDGAVSPFLSPDGSEVGFWADGVLKRVPLEGGTPVEITRLASPAPWTGSQPWGASWGDDNSIVFARAGGGLYRVPSSGGVAAESLAAHPTAHQPHVLPGSDVVLYTVAYGSRLVQRRIEAFSRRTGRVDTLLDNAADARYAAPDLLLFARTGTLMAVSFDLERFAVAGAARGVLPDVMHAMNGWNPPEWTNAAQYAVSPAGHLAYRGRNNPRRADRGRVGEPR